MIDTQNAISLEDSLVQTQKESPPTTAQQGDDLSGDHQRSKTGPSKTGPFFKVLTYNNHTAVDSVIRPKRKYNLYKTEEQRKRRTDPMMIGYGTSMTIIIKPMTEHDHIQSDESLNFQLQKDTKLVTLQEVSNSMTTAC